MTNKKTVAIVTLSILLLAVIFGIFRISGTSGRQPDAILAFIPVNSPVIIKARNFNSLLNSLESNNLWKETVHMATLESFRDNLGYFDSLRKFNKTFYNLLDNEIYISLHPIGKNSVGPIFYISGSRLNQFNITNMVSELVEGKGIFTTRKYENATIIDISLRQSGTKYSLTYDKGNMIISPSSILVENSIRQYHSGISVLDDKGFARVRATAGDKAAANIFIQYKHLDHTLALALNSPAASKLKKAGAFADWSELDLILKNNVVLLNGFIYSNDSSSNLLNILTGQAPKRFTMHSVFPANSNAFFSLSLSDPVLFKKKYHEHLRNTGGFTPYQARINKYTADYKTNFENLFYGLLSDEMAIVKCNTASDSAEQESFFVMATKGQNTSKEKLLELLRDWAAKENKTIKDYTTEYKIDDGASYQIYSFPVPTLVKDLFGLFFNFSDATYFTFIDKYLVFGSNARSLGRLAYTNVLNRTLDKSLEYNDFSEYINSRSNLNYYVKLARSKKILEQSLNPALNEIFSKNFKSFERINTLAFQIGGSENMLYNNITLSYYEETFDNPVTEWETLLDTSIYFKPVLVVNHNTNEQEIFVQDLKHNIYLINNSGRIIWKMKLGEPVMGDVFQVDYYKNGKFQLYFNTQSALHLIDRNGNYVDRYPVRLRAAATAGLSLFDYDKDRNYRIFVPCNNKKIYAYNLQGNLISGWEFNQTDSEVTMPVQHFRIDNKDYLVFADENKIYFVDRRGNTRIRTEKDISKAVNSVIAVENNRFVTTDNLGNICFITTNGAVEKINTGNFSSSHFFDFQDIDADGRKDFIIADGKNLFIYGQNQKLIFTYTFNSEIFDRPVYYHFSQYDRKIGILLRDRQEIYLINNNGRLYKGFPLIGNSLFTIGMLKHNYGKFNLIVSGRNNYLYNYAVN